MTTNDRITRFTIVGGGSAGWLTASLLVASLNRRNDGPDTEVTVIESPNLPIIGVGEATTLSTFVTFAELRINETAFFIIATPALRGQ
ncbi:MAG: tryptophan 7-halogenase [Alphaproteobacteria bacterium]